MAGGYDVGNGGVTLSEPLMLALRHRPEDFNGGQLSPSQFERFVLEAAEAAVLSKPSRDGMSRELNRRLREPYHKRGQTSETPLTLGDGITYGRHISDIGPNHVKEFRAPKRQIETLDKLLKLLRRPITAFRRGEYSRELLGDLKRYTTSALPQRSAYNSLMAIIEKAVIGNLQVDIHIVNPYIRDGKLAFGYEVK